MQETVRYAFSAAVFNSAIFIIVLKNSCRIKMKSWLKCIENPVDTQDQVLTLALISRRNLADKSFSFTQDLSQL